MFSDTLLPLESNYAGTFRTLSDGGDSGNEIFKGLQGCSGRVGGFQRFFVFKVGLFSRDSEKNDFLEQCWAKSNTICCPRLNKYFEL